MRVLGRYELIECLGRGGMGEVWRARDPALRRDVAVKVLRREGDGQGTLRDEFVQRFLREARSAASLKHPNIVAIHDVGVDAEPYIVMEYVEGTSLRGFIGKPDLTVVQRLAWLVEIAEALAAAHAIGLVHRDVKPDNVMITKAGHAKVLDFGIAKVIGDEDSPPSSREGEAPESFRTQRGRLVGTPKYMAPEQMTGDPIDARVDQWAWACVAYELLVGRMPDRDEAALPISLTLPDVPFDVAAAIVRARNPDPARRFPTMRALVDAISPTTVTDRLPVVEPIARRNPDAPTTTGAARRGARTTVIVVALASFALTAGTVLIIGRMRRHAAPATAESAACAFSPLPPTTLGNQRFVVRGASIGDGMLVSIIRVQADGSRVEELVTATSDAVTVREPAPMHVFDDGNGPNWAFPLGMAGGSHHYLYYDQGTRGGLVAGRLTTNDDVTDMMRLPRFIDDDTNFNPNFIAPVFAPHGSTPKPAFFVAGTERPKSGAMRGAIRMYDDRAGGTSLFRADVELVPHNLVAIASPERVAYSFVLGDKIYVGAVAPQTVVQHIEGVEDNSPTMATTSLEPIFAPLVVGTSLGGAALAFEGRDLHLVWSDAGHLRHGIVSIGDGGAGTTATSLEASSDGSTPALVIASDKTRLAWRDGTRIWYGEGPTVEAASRHASAFSEIGASNGPWMAPTSKGTLITWTAGATNEVRRSIATCK